MERKSRVSRRTESGRRGGSGNPQTAPESSSPSRAPQWVEAVRQAASRWYRQNGRKLPWRIDVTPYRVLVSEMMLVQTTVTAVIPYFERFLERFPDPGALAEADEDEVLKAWEGLGYYRRARQLQAAARLIVEQYAGELPPDPKAILALPGVGRYMAGAILSFAFDQPAPILEANSQRVLARLMALKDEIRRTSSQKQLWALAEELVPPEGAGDFNQALMDLGASICTPRNPSCLICPLASACRARELGLQDVLPVLAPRPSVLPVSEACAMVLNDGRILVVQRGEGGLWSKFWEFPTVNLDGADPAGRVHDRRLDLREGIENVAGVRAEVGREIRTLTYTVTRHRVALSVSLARALGGELHPGPGFRAARWIPPEELKTLALISPARKIAEWINQDPGGLSWG